MPDYLVYILYAFAVAIVVALSMKLGKYVDVIDAKSNISGAFIGGVMLAAVTSLPELFTSLSAVWIVKESSLVMGNILGSNLINLAFMGVILLIFAKGYKKAKFNKFYYAGLGVALAMYVLVALAMFFGSGLRLGWYSVVSPIIFVLYILYLHRMPKTESGDGDGADEKLTLKQAVVRFAICAVILIGASIALTYLTDIVADNLSLGKTFAGALFLGVATSLPELVSSVTLCARGNFNAAAGNIIGSDIFNFTILFVADILSFGNGSNIYTSNPDSIYLLVLGVAAAAITLVSFVVKNKTKPRLGALIGTEVLNAVPPALYILFLLLSTGVIVII